MLKNMLNLLTKKLIIIFLNPQKVNKKSKYCYVFLYFHYLKLFENDYKNKKRIRIKILQTEISYTIPTITF